MTVVLSEWHERQQSIAQQETEQESEQMGVVVHPGQQSDEKQDRGDGD